MIPPINDFYRVVDKNKHVQCIGTFDECFKELAELSIKLPGWGWRMEHVKDGKVVDE